MEKTNSEKAIEKIEFLIDRLINYSESNKYDYALYKSFAKKSSKAFKRYFSEIDDQTIKDKIISDLKEDFQFKVNDVVIKMMAKPKGKIENFENGETYQITQPSQDNRIEGYESNYKELIELFFNSVQLETKEPQQKENSEPDEVLLKNENIKIFKNDIGFSLFVKMFEFYKNETTHLANFSFLFFAMEKDFLVCSQADFKEFLRDEKYNIDIEKIDYRQLDWQQSKKANLYNSIKETLQKKHEKSTI